MTGIDGQEANMLQYYKDNNIPHSYQCRKCGCWMGAEPNNFCTHEYVIRDLRPFQKADIGTPNEVSDRDDSV
jgi:hypothetical protein